ncbi:WXG100 family type VII secretion target [Actinoplanes sp. NPDC049596]|uniref:WXG100 family type VII secretion target n=1 Tax=unclassified Actinoplanes TaxID=2626549 RepID=UPI0034470F52
MAGDQKKIDEASTRALLQAFQTAAEDQNAARNSGVTVQGTLSGAWQGNAADRFHQGMTEWLDGLNQVRNALAEIDGSMQSFARLTTTTEDDNMAQAAAGALSGASWT